MKNNACQLTTERLVLRPWQEPDAESLYKYAKDPAIGPVAGWPSHASVEDSLNIIRTVFSAPETYAVVLKETGEPVGSIGLLFGKDSHVAGIKADEAETGYWIGKPYWGQGLIPEAVRRLLQRCFEDLGMTAVWCGYYDGNTKSRRVMDKCGFRFHHMEKGKTSPLGDVRTEHFMKITKEESTPYTILLWRTPHFFLEKTEKMLRILKTEHIRNLFYTCIRFEQGIFCHFYDFQMNMFPCRLAGFSFDQISEIIGRQTYPVSEIFYRRQTLPLCHS